jgi:anti-sigma28 factor (negative regulator of flagellin synthesis)
MTETKQITLTGEAAKAMGGGGGGTRRRARGEGAAATRKAKKLTIDKEDEMEGGGSTSPGTLTQLATSNPGGHVQIEKVLGNAAPITAAAAPVGKDAPAVEPGLLKGGAANTVPVKVILKPKKKSTKVVLAPPKKAAVVPAAPVAAAASHSKKTRKASRNIKVSLPGLDKKLSKAKTIRQDAAKEKIEEVKKVLHKAGLIKADSKAPESILRQMYADFMVLKNRAL